MPIYSAVSQSLMPTKLRSAHAMLNISRKLSYYRRTLFCTSYLRIVAFDPQLQLVLADRTYRSARVS